MLTQSQPLDPKFCEKMGLNKKTDKEDYSEKMIKSQYIGDMFDDFHNDSKKRKIKLSLRLKWFWDDVTTKFYNIKYAIRNHFIWRKTIKKLRPWEGFDGLINVMQTHLKDYIYTEEKYGHSEEQYRKNKINTAKETLEILERMRNPDEYLDKHLKEVDSRYPNYKSLITKYKNGGSSSSGDFVPQGKGWVGIEGGNNPQEGYFEFVEGKFQLVQSPDQNETDKLLVELKKYHEERTDAYKQGYIDSDKDFERLGQLLKDNFYTWWD